MLLRIKKESIKIGRFKLRAMLFEREKNDQKSVGFLIYGFFLLLRIYELIMYGSDFYFLFSLVLEDN